MDGHGLRLEPVLDRQRVPGLRQRLRDLQRGRGHELHDVWRRQAPLRRILRGKLPLGDLRHRRDLRRLPERLRVLRRWHDLLELHERVLPQRHELRRQLPLEHLAEQRGEDVRQLPRDLRHLLGRERVELHHVRQW